jgi:tRNA A-37 threonylcarbamoyl transferase component Bud32
MPDENLASKLRPLLAKKPDEIFKQDRRSKDWLIDDGDLDQPVVVKRFMHSPIKQRLTWLLGLHPAQREIKAHQMLAELGIAVVPIVASSSFSESSAAWLATPYLGPTFQHVLAEGNAKHSWEQVIEAVSILVATLIQANIHNRDLKSSNIVIDNNARAWLIDAGAARTVDGVGQVARMLAMLEHTASNDGMQPHQWEHCLRLIVSRCPQLGDHDALYGQIKAVELPGH